MVEMVTGQLGAEGRYWEALHAGHAELPQCKGCGKWHWPAVWRCGECGSWEHEWHRQPLAGTIFSWTRTHHPFGGTEGFARPFTTVLVTLDTVPVRLLGVIEGDDAALKIGASVSGRIDRTPYNGAEIPSIRWRLGA